MNLKELLADEFFNESLEKSHLSPVILAGDLHSPSHLDWTKAARYGFIINIPFLQPTLVLCFDLFKLNEAKHKFRELHFDRVYEWPITSILARQTALFDSFRVVHPDPATSPGFTWSTVVEFLDGSDDKIKEPKDRIDYVFYRGRQLKPVNANVYPEHFTGRAQPYVADNDWPSDHFGVVIEFTWTP